MYHKPKISVVIPCYNSEKFVDKAIDSVLRQSLNEIEIILVNDGSNDKTSIILQQYKMEDNRIEVVSHGKNQGLGAARNSGMAVASGEYIFFLDSDDYLHPNFLESLYDKALQENLDILQAQFIIHTNENKEIYPKDLIPFLQPVNGIQYYNEGIFVEPKACGKLWKNSFIKENNLQFSNGYFEDMLMVHKAFFLAKRINNIILPGYHYIIRKESISQSLNKKHIVDYQKVIEELQAVFIYENITKKSSSFPASFGLYVVKLCKMAHQINDEQIYRTVSDFAKSIMNKYKKFIKHNRNLPYLKRKLMTINPCFYGKLKRSN
jgi:glycosyltransferase involved in cell wall biosynthesis